MATVLVVSWGHLSVFRCAWPAERAAAFYMVWWHVLRAREVRAFLSLHFSVRKVVGAVGWFCSASLRWRLCWQDRPPGFCECVRLIGHTCCVPWKVLVPSRQAGFATTQLAWPVV
jgi:hypothetical protein